MWDLTKVETIQLEDKVVEAVSEFLTKKIASSSGKHWFEGAFYTGSGDSSAIVTLVYNSDRGFAPMTASILDEERDYIEHTTGFDIQTEEWGDWKFTEEERKLTRWDYPIEMMLCHGNILYDKNGKLKELQTKMQNDREVLEQHTRGVCHFEPPLRLTKSLNND